MVLTKNEVSDQYFTHIEKLLVKITSQQNDFQRSPPFNHNII